MKANSKSCSSVPLGGKVKVMPHRAVRLRVISIKTQLQFIDDFQKVIRNTGDIELMDPFSSSYECSNARLSNSQTQTGGVFLKGGSHIFSLTILTNAHDRMFSVTSILDSVSLDNSTGKLWCTD